jgi:amino acid transporter
MTDSAPAGDIADNALPHRRLARCGGAELEGAKPDTLLRGVLDSNLEGIVPHVRGPARKKVAKMSVSALMFDYVLTGPISGVSAGQYIISLGLETYAHVAGHPLDGPTKDAWKSWGSVAIACLVTLYFFRQNILGIHESSDKALKIMVVTTIMAAVLIAWCSVTLMVDGPRNGIPLAPDLGPKPNPTTNEMEEQLGFLSNTNVGAQLRDLQGTNWLSLIGLVGLFIAFGHSILAMSGEETLAQVYREVESPKLANFKKAAFIVFVYSLVFTAGISFLAVLLIPNDVRMSHYADNLLGGLAMNVIGPPAARLLLNGFVVVVGFLILSGAVNTAIIGSNGVLNRVAEDGVLSDWFLKPHARYGTTYRILSLIVGLQLVTILISRGDVLLLGEAYAFGVVWSFVFKALAMVVLRFKRPEPRPFQVPLNIRVGPYAVPIGLILIFLVLLVSAVMNLLTKEVATKWGLGFTVVFLILFLISERYRARSPSTKHQDQFNHQDLPALTPESMGLKKPFRTMVAIHSPRHLALLDEALERTDPQTTDVVVLKAKLALPEETRPEQLDLDFYDRELMTAVLEHAEKAGKEVHPVIIPTNRPLDTILKTAQSLKVRELVLGTAHSLDTRGALWGAFQRRTPERQILRIAAAWRALNGHPAKLTVSLAAPDGTERRDIGGD